MSEWSCSGCKWVFTKVGVDKPTDDWRCMGCRYEETTVTEAAARRILAMVWPA